MYDREKKRYVAVKVKHPNVDKKIKEFMFVVKLLRFFFRLPILNMVVEYTENINIQLNYELEAKNTILLKEKFKNEPLIKIPEIYEWNNDFIFMEYVKGVSFDTITDPSLQTKISLYINYFMLTSILVHDFIHSDLHTGNWKIQMNDGNIKIVVYDCGLVTSTNDLYLNKKIIKYTLNNNYRKLLHFVLKNKLEKEPSLYFKIDKCVYACTCEKSMSSQRRLETFVKHSIQEGFFNCNKGALKILNSFIIINKIASVGVNNLCKFIYIKKDSSVAIILYIHLYMLRKMGVFKDLEVFFTDWLGKNTSNKLLFDVWLINEFGHSNENIFIDTVYNLLLERDEDLDEELIEL